MDQQINSLEGQITKSIKREWNETIEGMNEQQHKRNRSIIKEIITTSETFRTEIKEEFTLLRGEEDD